ncbi:MAG: phosphoenolpyruvate carboxykinase (ATP) [Flammeovirgaceae bacterium]|nr:phosphoenolpyruvate carboxykinase (ATP) [Flammeovirgaceae bacterium]|tara:strand:- start:9021 stop:10631 length:1611 start_codon:yes stop_codon:yes gene_type:complete
MNRNSNDLEKHSISLEEYGIKCAKINYNFSVKKLYKICLNKKLGLLTDNQVLAINTGKFTGRSPKDRYIVSDSITADKVWWGEINRPIQSNIFDKIYNKLIKHLSEKELYVRDSYACASKKNRLNLRTICEYPWSDIFSHNMFLRPEKYEKFEIEWTVISAPSFEANPLEDGIDNKNFSIINFSKKIIIIGGTGYTGEIKKGIFSVLNFTLPVEKNILPMHCSANAGEKNDTSIFFGLSGTGKTTLSTDSSRKLIGDDEHGWDGDNNIFNFEGGCYAKVLNLSEIKEPEIYSAIRPGALLENVVIDDKRKVDFKNKSITQNSRVSYPINFINNIMKPSIGNNPKNIFFLTADAFGVLPPISKLTPSQSAYHFISGYTSKLAGTEDGVDEPVPSFSACFGAPFMPLHPTVYAKMLIKKMNGSAVNVWLVSTGWTGGPYGTGRRMELKYTRAMINAAISGELDKLNKDNYHIHSVFNLMQPRVCPNVPSDVLSPRRTWNNDKKYYKNAYMLSSAFVNNFKQFSDRANLEILSGAPNTR